MNAGELGRLGERLAREYYEEQGYRLQAANYRTRQGEVDLILERGALWVFAEVKARGAGAIASPREWVDAKKQRRIMAAAMHYLMENKLSEPLMRFDVVELVFDGADKLESIRCIEGAFTA